MNTYKINIKFKDGKDLTIDTNAETDPRESIDKAFDNKEKIFKLGDYFIKSDEILWIKVEGETLAEPIRE